MANLRKLMFKPGKPSNKGQTLARFDSTDQELALAAAKMNLAELNLS